MKRERWRQVEVLCFEALNREPDERAGFLDVAAAGDADLRCEVESLLRYAGPTDDPLDESAGEGVTRLVRGWMGTGPASGTALGPYQIEAVLGSGGMGTVYRALDTRLGRAVALKFLNGQCFADDSAQLLREARAAARLDHPNICSIYEVVEDESRCFIVMQYVEGETLANRMARQPLDLCEALEITTQIADALGEAHARGIVHRDVKPQNIMITPRGQSKVLDFGLAKAVNPDASTSGAETLTDTTEKGLVAGTVAYMSPEQARGQELDARTDLFSLAVVLFEMSTGISPFRQITVPLTLDAILTRSPVRPGEIVPTLPAELDRIIFKGLAKDRDLRYQSASELVTDLKGLQRDLQAGPSTTAAPPVPRLGWHPGYVLAGLLIAVVMPILVFSRSVDPPGDAEHPRYVQLTNFTDSATNPALSSDGRMLTFIRGLSTFLDPGPVYVKLLPDGEPVRLTHDDDRKMAPAFSPDGSRIAYTVLTASPDEWATRSVPVLGGTPRPMLANAAALTWIGDGRILFSRIKRDQHMAIVTGSESRPELRDVYVPPTKTGMAHRSHLSPDGRWVLIASEMNSSGWLPCRVVPLAGTPPGRIVGPRDARCTYAGWSPDGQWMYFSADVGQGFHIWRQSFPDGMPEQITFGATEEEGIAVWPDGGSIASSVGIKTSSIWVHDDGREHQITSEGYGQLPSFSADGKTLYYLLRGSGVRQWASGELWAFDRLTGRRRQIFGDISMAQYEVSSDGTRVVFVRTDRGKEGVWIAHLDGSPRQVQVTSTTATGAFFGPAGTVLVQSGEGPAEYLFRLREDGSDRHKVTTEPVIEVMSVSPDRRWAVVWTQGSGNASGRPLVAYRLDGGDAVRLCENCASAYGPERGTSPPMLAWSGDGRDLFIAPHAPSDTQYETGRTYVLHLASASALPPTFKDEKDLASMPDVQVIPHGGIFPGPHPSLYAYVRAATHRNLYRISIP